MTSLFASSRTSLRQRGLALTQVMALCYFASIEVCSSVYSLKLTLRRRGGEGSGPGAYTWSLPDDPPIPERLSLPLGQISGVELGRLAAPSSSTSTSSAGSSASTQNHSVLDADARVSTRPVQKYDQYHDLTKMSDDSRKTILKYLEDINLVDRDEINRKVYVQIIREKELLLENNLNAGVDADASLTNELLLELPQMQKVLVDMQTAANERKERIQAFRKHMMVELGYINPKQNCSIRPYNHDEEDRLLEQYKEHLNGASTSRDECGQCIGFCFACILCEDIQQ